VTQDPERRSRPETAAIRTRHLPVPGARLYVREVGAGPPLVVLHGGPEFSHDYFVPELDALAAYARLVYYDQRGRGQSGDGVRGDDVSIDSEMQDLERLRQWLGSPTIALLGHSWGGLLAMEYAVRYPDRVTHIVLMNSVPASHRHFLLMREARNRLLGEQIEVLSSLRDTPAHRSGDVETERQFLRLLFQRACHDPAIAEQVVPRFLIGMTPARIVRSRGIGQRLAEQTWLRDDYDLLPALSRARAAALVIHGERDFIPEDGVLQVTRSIPGGRFALLPGCGHFAFFERPVEVDRLIRDFLRTPPGGVP
jgi:proline iminopeptidase